MLSSSREVSLPFMTVRLLAVFSASDRLGDFIRVRSVHFLYHFKSF